MSLTDTAGPQVLPAVKVIPGSPGLPEQANTVPLLLGVRLPPLPPLEVNRAAVQPGQGVTEEDRPQPGQVIIVPIHEEREEGVLQARVDGGELASLVETVAVAVRHVGPSSQHGVAAVLEQEPALLLARLQWRGGWGRGGGVICAGEAVTNILTGVQPGATVVG